MKSWVKSKGIETQFELAGEFELPGLHCNGKLKTF